MANKKKDKSSNNLSNLIKDIKDSILVVPDAKIPDIIEFMESPKYLGFKNYAQPIEAYPFQRIVLKTFYRGTIGNENIQLTAEEVDLMKKWGLDDDANGNLLGKWASGEEFRELILVWGRRAGKDFVGSIIALYEAMKLLESSGGNPYAFYKLATAAPFTILTIANSSQQASIAYTQIKDKFLRSQYFKDKFIPEGVLDDSIYLLTPQDKIDNKILIEKGLKSRPGSILIRIGHSDSNTLVGLDCYVIIFDEIGLYPTTAGPSSGENLYSNLTPSVRTYVRKEQVIDENGNIVFDEEGKPAIKYRFDGKVICISSPRASEGIFYKLYSTSNVVKHRLMCRLPSWAVNINYSKESLREESSEFSDEKFMMEFGAVFSGTAGESMFPRELVESCFTNEVAFSNVGKLGKVYFAHLDPATSSHNYALVVCHPEYLPNEETKNLECHVIVDHVKFWAPQDSKPINVDKIDEYMIEMNKRFHFGLITYDQWRSEVSILKLRKFGMPSKLTFFSSKYKVMVYDSLERAMIGKKLKIPKGNTPDERKASDLLRLELINLQRKYTSGGYRVYPKKEGDTNTDDIADALAGAVYNSVDQQVNKLPKGKLINMPVLDTYGNTPFRSMQGTVYDKRSLDVINRVQRRGPY